MLPRALQIPLKLRSTLLRWRQQARLQRWVARRDAEKSGEMRVDRGKVLYAAPIGSGGKDLLAKLIGKLGYVQFDYLIFVYDGSRFDEAIFSGCTFIRE